MWRVNGVRRRGSNR